MARFRKVRRARAKSFGGRFKRVARRSGVGSSASLIQLDAMIYGAVRAPISDKVQSMLPVAVLGGIGDEVAMGLVSWLVAKNTSGMIRNVALKGLVIENARLGESLMSMSGLGNAIGGSSSNTQLLG